MTALPAVQMLHAQTCVLCFLDVVQISFSINGDPSCAHELAPLPFVFCRMDENSAFNRWISVLGSVGGFCGLIGNFTQFIFPGSGRCLQAGYPLDHSSGG